MPLHYRAVYLMEKVLDMPHAVEQESTQLEFKFLDARWHYKQLGIHCQNLQTCDLSLAGYNCCPKAFQPYAKIKHVCLCT